ncbi:MAG: sulfotransferase family protein [Chthoniobacterales bacterium]
MAPSFITVVSGLPRSGTSLMMQVLAAGGLPSLTDSVRESDENNPRGYFEFEAVKKLRLDSSWLKRAQGHAIKIIHVLLRELPTDGRFSYRVLFMQRALDEVLASQAKMLQRAGKSAADPALLVKTFTAQIAQVKEWMSGQPAFAFLEVEHQRLITQPEIVAGEVAQFLGLDLAVPTMAEAVDPALYRERQSLN